MNIPVRPRDSRFIRSHLPRPRPSLWRRYREPLHALSVVAWGLILAIWLGEVWLLLRWMEWI